MPVTLGIAALTTGYGIYKNQQAKRQQEEADEEAKRLLQARPDYKPSPYRQAMLADTRARMGAVSNGSLAAYQQLNQGVASQMAHAQRNAASGAQALATGADAQGRANMSIPGLVQAQEAIDRQNRGEYYNALEGMDKEHKSEFDSDMGLYSDNMNWQLGRVGAASANQSAALGVTMQGIGSLANTYNNRRYRATAPKGW